MKIQCACGAKYAFEVTPEMAQTPMQFVCPACGQDSSDQVNEMIRQALSQATTAATEAATTPLPSPGTRIRIQTEAAHSPEAAQLCPKHPGQLAAARCLICQKPICPKCMELFGYVCSALCKGKAEAQRIEIPVYEGQKTVVHARFWRKVGGIAAVIGVVLAALLGFWFWYAWFGSVPKPVFSVRFDEPSYAGAIKLCEPDQIVFLHGGTLARHDLKTKKEIWSQSLIERKEIEAQAAKMFQQSQDAGETTRPGVRNSSERFANNLEREAEEELELQVRGRNVWVLSRFELTRYDWDTGKPVQTIPLGSLAGKVLRGDELLVVRPDRGLGQQSVMHLNLASGQTNEETIANSPRPGLAATGNTSGVSGSQTSSGSQKPLDPAATAARVQNMPYAGRIALPAVLAIEANQQRALAEMSDRPSKSDSVPMSPSFAGESLVPTPGGYVQYSVQLLESRIVAREAMKAPPKKSALNGNLTAGDTTEAQNEILNEMQRVRGGNIVHEDLSRYQVTLSRPGATNAADWTGEVIGPPDLHPLETVTVLTAGTTVMVFDRNNLKLWQSTLSHNVPAFGAAFSGRNSPYGAGPCVERAGALYVFDEGVLTAFDLMTGNVRWRLPSVGVAGLLFDDQGMMYVNTAREPDATHRGFLDGDIGFRDVDTDARIVEFLDEHIKWLLVEDIHEDDDNVGAPDDGDDFLATALAHSGTGDESRDIEGLDLCSFVFECAGHYGERGKRIRGDRARGTGELVEERAFTCRREPDEHCGRVAGLFDLSSLPRHRRTSSHGKPLRRGDGPSSP